MNTSTHFTAGRGSNLFGGSTNTGARSLSTSIRFRYVDETDLFVPFLFSNQVDYDVAVPFAPDAVDPWRAAVE